MEARLVAWKGISGWSAAHIYLEGQSKTICGHRINGNLADGSNGSRMCKGCPGNARNLGITVPGIEIAVEPMESMKAPRRSRRSRTNWETKNIITAIQALGGISPRKIERAGIRTDFNETVPARVRRQVLRHYSTNGLDDIATQLCELGYQVEDMNALMEMLRDPELAKKLSLDPELEVESEKDYLEREVNRLQMENEELRMQLEGFMRAEGCFDPIEEALGA